MPDKPPTRKQLVARRDNLTRRLVSKTSDCHELSQELTTVLEQLADMGETPPTKEPARKGNGHRAEAGEAS